MLKSSSQNSRPYFTFNFNQLSDVAKKDWCDINKLQILKEELTFRNKPWSVSLRNRVNNRLTILENNISVSPPKIKLKLKQKFKNSDSFSWVSTEVGFGFEKLDTSGWQKNDLLSKLGYKTGHYSDLDYKTRRSILYKAYKEEFPKEIANQFTDIENWGSPNTSTRLRMIAESIARVVRHEKMHSYDYALSISERESDLADLKRKFYNGNYDKK